MPSKLSSNCLSNITQSLSIYLDFHEKVYLKHLKFLAHINGQILPYFSEMSQVSVYVTQTEFSFFYQKKQGQC